MKKPLRLDLVLPVKLDGFRDAQLLMDWYEDLWKRWTPDTIKEGDVMLLTYLSLLIDSGLPHQAAKSVILAIRSEQGKLFVRTTIEAQRYVYSYGNTILHFSKRTQLAIKCWKGRYPDAAYKTKNRDAKKRAKKILYTLRKSYNKIKQHSRIENVDFGSVNQISTVIAMHHGFDPYLISIYSGSTRVTDQDSNDIYALTNRSQENMVDMIHTVNGVSTTRRLSIDTEGVRSDSSNPGDYEWCSRSQELLRNMCAELQVTFPRRLTQWYENEVRRIISQSRVEALTFSDERSALVAAIDYAEKMIVEDRTISSRSLRDYLDRCVINGLLSNPEAYSLEDWDPDDFIENFEQRITRAPLTKRSRENIQNAYRSFFKFLSRNFGISGLPKDKFGQNEGNAAGQWQLLSPGAVDALIGILSESGKLIEEQVALAIGIGYYGGLRASEVKNLTCASLVFNESLPNLDVEIERGKSASARRRMPFDTLAPLAIQKRLKDYSLRRREEMAGRALRNIALFGPSKNPDGYTYDTLIRLVRGYLQNNFGKTVNFHTLRHCFCSNLFLRWYALRHPDILQELVSGRHELFQPCLQDGLEHYFSCLPIDDGDIRPYDLISMIKLTGHASPTVLFNYYIHSAFVIQKHAVEMADRQFPPPCPSDRVLKALVPRMKSSRSRAKFRKEWDNLVQMKREEAQLGKPTGVARVMTH